jgi:hypothetical protein
MKVVDTSSIKATKERKKFNRLPKSEVMKILSENLSPVYNQPHDTILDASKYTRLARDYHFGNYKMCSWMDIKNLGLEDSFTTYQKQFFADAGATIAIFNELNGKLISVVFRSISEKAFMDYSITYNLYGYDMIDPDFKYGDYLVLTEGIYDADCFRRIYPNTMAMLTSNITLMQSAILKTLTDKFIIAFDSDNAGDKGFSTAIKRLGVDIKKLKIYPGDKDLGEMEEMRLQSPYEFEKRNEFYREMLHECFTTDGFSL